MTRSNPAHEELQAVVGRALVDPTFRKGLLNGHRAECLAEFDLSDTEAEAARSIQADDLTTFAAQLDAWIARQSATPVAGGAFSFREDPVWSRSMPAAA